MAYEDTNLNRIEEMDFVRFTITLPRSEVEDDVVRKMRDVTSYSEETIRMVGLLGYLTVRYGYHYKTDLLGSLVFSMAESLGFDEEDAQAFRQGLETAIRDYRDDNPGH